MRVDIPRWMRHAMFGLIVGSIASTGCTSTSWKMPSPTKMFSWGKKPDEAKLAGSGPSSLTYPESPASKQTPNALATTQPGKATNPYGATASTSPYGAPASTSPYGATAATQPGAKSATAPYTPPGGVASAPYTPPASGSAAAANGYPTGPYNTFGTSNAASSLATNGAPNRPAVPPAGNPFGVNPQSAASATPPNGGVPAMPVGFASAAPYSPPAAPANGLPSTQTYGGAGTSGTAGRPVGMAAANPNYPNMNTSGAAFPQAATAPGARPQVPTNNVAGLGAPNPYAAPGQAAPMVNPMAMPTNGGSYMPVGTNPAGNGLAQLPPNMNGAPMSGFAAPGLPASGPSATPAQTASYTNPSAATTASTASYRPGTTSRTTGYNFNSPAAAPTGSNPYVATPTSNPGYSLPPNSTLNR